MSDKYYNAEVVKDPLHAVLLGSLAPMDSGWNLTIEHRSDSLRSGFCPKERDFLSRLERKGAARLYSTKAAVNQLDVEAVMRRQFRAVSEISDGYEFQVEGGTSFVLSEFGLRLLVQVDGERSLAKIANAVMTDTLNDAADRLIATVSEAEAGRSFESIVFDQALLFMKSMTSSGAATLEPLA